MQWAHSGRGKVYQMELLIWKDFWVCLSQWLAAAYGVISGDHIFSVPLRGAQWKQRYNSPRGHFYFLSDVCLVSFKKKKKLTEKNTITLRTCSLSGKWEETDEHEGESNNWSGVILRWCDGQMVLCLDIWAECQGKAELQEKSGRSTIWLTIRDNVEDWEDTSTFSWGWGARRVGASF